MHHRDRHVRVGRQSFQSLACWHSARSIRADHQADALQSIACGAKRKPWVLSACGARGLALSSRPRVFLSSRSRRRSWRRHLGPGGPPPRLRPRRPLRAGRHCRPAARAGRGGGADLRHPARLRFARGADRPRRPRPGRRLHAEPARTSRCRGRRSRPVTTCSARSPWRSTSATPAGPRSSRARRASRPSWASRSATRRRCATFASSSPTASSARRSSSTATSRTRSGSTR